MRHRPLLLYILAGFIEALGLFFLTRFPSYRSAALFIGGFIVVFVMLLLWHAKAHNRSVKADHIAFVVTTVLACGALLSVIEWGALGNLLIVLFGCLTALVFRLIDHMEGAHLSYQMKPFRRMVVMLWVFDVYALSTVLFALALFFPDVSRWLFVGISGLIYALASFVMWRLYRPEPFRFYRLWVGVIALVSLELTAVLHALPFGYAASGLIATWLWYLAHLLIRFYLDRGGIIWKKQLWFGAVNAILFLTLLIFVVRWI